MHIVAKMLLICIVGLAAVRGVTSRNVLMVIGGQFFNTTSREHEPVSSVEVIGEKRACEISGLPTPLYGMTAGRVGNTVLVCGGFYYYYRSECYEYIPTQGVWAASRLRLENATAFMSSFAGGNEFYMAGGRDYRGGDGRSAEDWSYWGTLTRLEANQWQQLVDLPAPISDACIVQTNTGGQLRMWLIGGSDFPQRYKTEVYSVDLGAERKVWKKMPDMLDPRMWQACAFTEVEGVKGILVAGGYYNGVSSMWLPLEDRFGHSLETFGLQRNLPKWEWFSSLTTERKWGAAIGYIGDKLALAGGGDYGDNTVEVLSGRYFGRSKVVMKFKREFTTGVTVPSEWFPQCRF